MRKPVYLDYQATTPVDPRVLEAMLPFFSEDFGNPSSMQHEYGWRADAAVQKSREQIANFLSCEPQEIVFTAGATESNNLAITGVASAVKTGHFITTAIEHPAVLEPMKAIQRSYSDSRLTILSPKKSGQMDLNELRSVIDEGTRLVSIIAANNEIGSIQPIEEIGKICKEKGVLFHTDATQAIGEMNLSVEQTGVDLLAFSGHKIYGPKGIGVLVVRRKNPRVSLAAQCLGGGQERGLRSGTLNVPGIVGIGEAVRLIQENGPTWSESIRALRDRFLATIQKAIDVQVVADMENRLPQNLSLRFPGIRSEDLLSASKYEVAFSAGSACSSGKVGGSHVLLALGLAPGEVNECVRISFGRTTTIEEVDFAAESIIRSVKNRKGS